MIDRRRETSPLARPASHIPRQTPPRSAPLTHSLPPCKFKRLLVAPAESCGPTREEFPAGCRSGTAVPISPLTPARWNTWPLPRDVEAGWEWVASVRTWNGSADGAGPGGLRGLRGRGVARGMRCGGEDGRFRAGHVYVRVSLHVRRRPALLVGTRYVNLSYDTGSGLSCDL